MSYKFFVSPSTLKQTDKVQLMRWATEHHMPSEPGVAFERWLDALQGVDKETKAKALALSRGWTSSPAAALPHDLVAAEARWGLLGLFALAAAAILAVGRVAGEAVQQVVDTEDQVDDTKDWMDLLVDSHDETVAGETVAGDLLGEETARAFVQEADTEDGDQFLQEQAAAAAADAPVVAKQLLAQLEEKASGTLCGLTSICSTFEMHTSTLNSANAYLKKLTTEMELHQHVQAATLGEVTLKCLQHNPDFLKRMREGQEFTGVLEQELIALTSSTGIQGSITKRVQHVIVDILKYSPRRLNSAGNFEMAQLKSIMRMVADTRLELYSQGKLPLDTNIVDFVELYIATDGNTILDFINLEGELATLIEQATGESKVVKATFIRARRRLIRLFPKQGDLTQHQQNIKKIYDSLVTVDGSFSDILTNLFNQAAMLMKSVDAASVKILNNMRAEHNKQTGDMRGDYIKTLRLTLAEQIGPYAFAWIAGVVVTLLAMGPCVGGLTVLKRFCYDPQHDPQHDRYSIRYSDVDSPYFYKPGNVNPALRGKYAQLCNGKLRHVYTSNGRWGAYPSDDDAHLYLPVQKDANDIWTINHVSGSVTLTPTFKKNS